MNAEAACKLAMLQDLRAQRRLPAWQRRCRAGPGTEWQAND